MSMHKRKLFWVGLMAIALGALVLGACKSSVGLKFSHRSHIVEQEATCDQCHKKDANGNLAAATMADCQECHEINVNEPSKECLLCHTPESAAKDYEIERAGKPANYTDLIFSHKTHTDLACDSCHTSMGQNYNLKNGPFMVVCLNCHKNQGAPMECEACHTVLRADQAPASHHQDWEAKHGFASRLSDSCSYCHPNRQAFCEKCHQTEKPKDHKFGWKTTGHGVEATHDRRTCATCHSAGYCVDCHKHQKPVSHFRGDWMAYQRDNGHGEAARRNFRSCNVCHETGECMQCHKGIILRK